MTTLGNILLVIASLLYAGTLSVVYGKAPRGGDALMGYAWAVLLLYGIFSLTMIAAAGVVGAKNGYDWVSPDAGTRFIVVSVVLLGALATTVFSAFFRYENGPVPTLFRLYSGFAPALIPLFLIGAGFVLVNPSLRASVSPAVYQWPLVSVATLTALAAAIWLFWWVVNSQKEAKANAEARVEQEKTRNDQHLADIDNVDVSKDMVFLLVFTDSNHEPEVRERALAKIYSRPDWEQEMIRLLNCEWAPEAFTFLASNDVDKKTFAEPVRQGILNQAVVFRKSIRNSSHEAHFYEDQFLWDLERVFRTLEKFKDTGVDYKPAVQELRNALDEPTDLKKPDWQAKKELDRWLRK